MWRTLPLFGALLIAGCSGEWDAPLPPPWQRAVETGSALAQASGDGLSRRAHLDARVLVISRRDYSERLDDPLSRFSPIDLAVAWGGAATRAGRSDFSVRQPWRRYSWSYGRPVRKGSGMPSVVRDFMVSTANWHIVPASAAVRMDMDRIGRGDVVSMSGFLVDVDLGHGRRARTSLRRDDQGDGACEIFLVEEMRIES